jgi:hypothetical protein
MKNQNLINNLFYISALLIISGVLLKITNYTSASFIYLAGACLFTLSRVIFLVTNKEKIKGRISQIQIFSGLLLIISAYLMYKGSNSWSVLILLSALIEIYSSFRGNNLQGKP